MTSKCDAADAHEERLARLGWAWFTNDFAAHVPQINAVDASAQSRNWTDTQALAYVLRQLAHDDAETFAAFLELNMLSMAEEWAWRGMLDPEVTKQTLATHLTRFAPIFEKMRAEDPEITLPEEPPLWLKLLKEDA